MGDLFSRYEIKIDCDDTSCSLRYSRDGETYGILRFVYYKSVGIFSQDIILLKEMEINRMLHDMMFETSREEGEKFVRLIREDGTKKIEDHIKKLSPRIEEGDEKDID